MYERVILTLDGSELSEAAIPVAQRLASGTDTKLDVVTVAEPPKARIRRTEGAKAIPEPGTYGAVTQPEFEEEEHVDERRQRIASDLARYIEDKASPLTSAGLNVTSTVKFGDDTAKTIASYAKDSNADAIIMATHGRSGLSEALFGSVAHGVLKSGVAPVIMVKPEE